MTLGSLLRSLGPAIESVEEETFELFAQDLPSHNLGFIDSRATTLELTIAGRDLTIHQSPSVLSSNRPGGTTGAVVWKITPLFAEWLSAPGNPLFAHGVLSAESLVLELGCGVSALVGLLLGPRVGRYVLSDQAYVARLVERNLAENQSQPVIINNNKSPPGSAAAKGRRSRAGRGNGKAKAADYASNSSSHIHFLPLDWETDAVTSALAAREPPPTTTTTTAEPPRKTTPTTPRTGDDGRPAEKTKTQKNKKRSFDLVLACDCIYNEALIEPFVTTCADACRLRLAESSLSFSSASASASDSEAATEAGAETRGGPQQQRCVCVIAQQLRDPLVFEAWLARFAELFHVWRIPDGMLLEGLRANSGFVVHVGVLKEVSGV